MEPAEQLLLFFKYCILLSQPFLLRIMFTFYLLKLCHISGPYWATSNHQVCSLPMASFFFFFVTVEEYTEYTIITVKNASQPCTQTWRAGGLRHRCYLHSPEFFSVLQCLIPVFAWGWPHVQRHIPLTGSIPWGWGVLKLSLDINSGVHFKIRILKYVLRACGLNNSVAWYVPWSPAVSVAPPSNGSTDTEGLSLSFSLKKSNVLSALVRKQWNLLAVPPQCLQLGGSLPRVVFVGGAAQVLCMCHSDVVKVVHPDITEHLQPGLVITTEPVGKLQLRTCQEPSASTQLDPVFVCRGRRWGGGDERAFRRMGAEVIDRIQMDPMRLTL